MFLRKFENLSREKSVEFVDLVKRFPTRIWTRKSASIQPRTSPTKFDHLAEKIGRKVRYPSPLHVGCEARGPARVRLARAPGAPGGADLS